MKNNSKFSKLISLCAFLTLSCGAASVLASCNASESIYTIEKGYTVSQIKDIPADMVNYVMFAYGDYSDQEDSYQVVNVKTTLTLNPSTKTYELYKMIDTPKVHETDDGMVSTYTGEYYFNGIYEEADKTNITLKTPTSGKYSAFYPTVLNYQSVEKQTQGYVQSTDYPTMMTRFNNWYPQKNTSAVDQGIVLSGKTMTFGSVTMPSDDDKTSTSASTEESTEASTSTELPEGVILSATDTGKTMNLNKDGTYDFTYSAYNVTEKGTWTWKEYKLTVTRADDTAFEGAFNADYNVALEFTSQSSSQLKASFVFNGVVGALGASYTPAE
ncbi:MAG: hypothetical protein WCR67_04750 [Bacilli bacterium]